MFGVFVGTVLDVLSITAHDCMVVVVIIAQINFEIT